MRWYLAWVAILAALFCIRLTHRNVLWVEEAYPAAAAIQMDYGRILYQDIQYDKPPLSAAIYRLWGGRTDWPLRLAGAIYVTLCCLLAHLVARHWWGLREAWLAALLLAFYLTFGIPAAVMALAPDLLSILPTLAAVLALIHGQNLLAGLCLGLAIGCNGKVLLLTPLLFFGGGHLRQAIGLAVGVGLALPLTGNGMGARAMWDQVWLWGATYSGDSPLPSPYKEGLVRTLAWCGFQGTAVLASGWFFWRERSKPGRMLAVWMVLGLIMVWLGLRFAPRYYLVLLPCVALAAARGLCLMPSLAQQAVMALLLIPGARFGPKYAELAVDQDMDWADTAMNRDSAVAARLITAKAKPGDTILVWGYRPDILVYTRLALGAPFLDSQPLTGVLADRHLNRSDVTFPKLAEANRARLSALSPTWVADGLGPYNPALAISNYRDLESWLARYVQVADTAGTRIYRRR